MLDRNNAASRIARELLAVEDAINHALACSAALTQSVALGRMIDGVSRSSAQESVVRLAAVQQHLSKSATEMMRVHRDLRRTHEEITAMPDGNGDCPELGVPVTGLRAAG
ncbi:hypothetical protein [Qipengyuania sediminis]|uniref:hypothetical protein n=1 Tax=Qipengyuania sediminis TaxID=1532023 RepID=UPI00105A27F5|nr:hypothetical protein [Qipengyuania sediminis]